MRKMGLMSSAGPGEEMKYQQYMKKLKEACAERLVKKLFENDGLDFKFWLGFGKKPFLGQKFNWAKSRIQYTQLDYVI